MLSEQRLAYKRKLGVIMNDKVVMMNIKDVTPYDNNPRQNDAAVKSVANSIKQFGFKQPIVVDKDNVIIVGHTRLKAAKRLKLKEVPVIVADDLNADQVRMYRLADNRVGELADWDSDALMAELDKLNDSGLDFGDFGFNGEFFEEEGIDLDNPTSSGDDIEGDDFDEEPVENPKSKLGDIYQLGRHRLMVGDSTNVDHVKALMNGEQADLLLTDPPYNIAYEGKQESAMTIENDSMSEEDFRKFLASAFTAANENMKPGATFYIWYADTESYNFRGAAKDIGWQVRENLIWAKNTMVLGRQDSQWKHEPCLYGWKDGAAHNWYSDRKQTTVLEFDKPQRSDIHPTMKPVALFDYQMQNSSKAGDLVLDIFGGSGTTLVVAEQNGRDARLMELDPRYADVIINRYWELTGMEATLVDHIEP